MCTILIILIINYVVIEWIIYVKLRYGINFRTSCWQVADKLQWGRGEVLDQSPTSFNDSHAPILTELVGDRSVTDRGLVGDFAGTCLRPNQSQPGFWTCAKTQLRLIWSQRGPRLVADFSATLPGPVGDLVATSAVGGNCQSRRGRKAVETYVLPGLKRPIVFSITPMSYLRHRRRLTIFPQGDVIIRAHGPSSIQRNYY